MGESITLVLLVTRSGFDGQQQALLVFDRSKGTWRFPYRRPNTGQGYVTAVAETVRDRILLNNTDVELERCRFDSRPCMPLLRSRAGHGYLVYRVLMHRRLKVRGQFEVRPGEELEFAWTGFGKLSDPQLRLDSHTSRVLRHLKDHHVMQADVVTAS